ncbi:phage scaffolding protein [Sporosarcina psychrophila]|uniref:Phage minor structural protein GP20 n=1 Tax=Sporosarcina psychrophila TaxID=1476 RepID=A0ABV2KCV6_SPOPS
MNREFLKGLGMDDAAVDKVMAEHGKTVEAHKLKTSGLETSVTDLQGQLTQRDTDLNDLKKKAEGGEELQKQLTTLQAIYDTEKAGFETKLKDTHFNSALKLALSGKVHDVDYAISLIDKEKIELDADGNVIKGLDEQIKPLRESKSFLFVPEGETGPGIVIQGAKPAEGILKGQEGAANPWSKETFNLTEQGRILRENPELAKQFQTTKQ